MGGDAAWQVKLSVASDGGGATSSTSGCPQRKEAEGGGWIPHQHQRLHPPRVLQEPSVSLKSLLSETLLMGFINICIDSVRNKTSYFVKYQHKV